LLPIASLLITPGTRPGLFADPVRLPGPACPGDQLVAFPGRRPRPVISAGKMSGLWSGQPNTVKLDELDVICAVLGCDVGELLLPGPVAVPEPAAG
jgi:hypothetical protein